jgi:hypothetical protein
VTFQDKKVLQFDTTCRHKGKSQFYYTYPDAVTTCLFFDAHVSLKKTGKAFNQGGMFADANDGVDPTTTTGTYKLAGAVLWVRREAILTAKAIRQGGTSSIVHVSFWTT